MRDCEKVALVTGGSRGVGRSVAEALGQRGIRVVVNYRTDQAGADACLAAVREQGGDAIAVAANVAEHDEARRLFDRAIEQFGHVDVIVHSATPPIVYQPYLETSADEFRRYFETYVLGLHELARLAAPGMKERQYGRIVALLSSAISEVPSKMAAYIAGKYALLGLCRALAVELGPWGIGVNTVTPSMIVGPHAEAAGVAAREIVARKTPLRRLGQTEDVARAVLFLISDDAAFVSGANLPVTGGIFV